MLLSFKLFILLISEIILINCYENEYINTRTLLSDDHNTLIQQRSSKLSPTIILKSSSDNTIESESQIKKLQIMNEIYSITKIYSVFKNHKSQFEFTQIDTNHGYTSTCDFMKKWVAGSWKVTYGSIWDDDQPDQQKLNYTPWKCNIKSGLLIALRFDHYGMATGVDTYLYGTVDSVFWLYISKLTQLQHLGIFSLAGFPSEGIIDGNVDWDSISQMTSLITLIIGDTKINGPIELSKLPHSLQYLYLSSNEFDSSINLSNDLRMLKNIHGNLVSLKKLDLSYNEELTGKIGDFRSIPTSITFIDLNGNNFTGTVDFSGLSTLTDEYSSYSSLSKLYLSQNNLIGTINLNDIAKSNLKTIHLYNNHFTDVIPYNGNARYFDVSCFANDFNGNRKADDVCKARAHVPPPDW